MAKQQIQEILAAFEYYDGIYKRDAVDAAIALKEEITPHLIGVLEKVSANPAEYAPNEDYMAHLYAFMLLGHFKEPQAHQVIVNLFSLPERYISPLFDDIITEDLPAVLYHTCGGSLDRIKGLAENQDAYEYCRSSALRALNYAVAGGLVSRAAVLEYYHKILLAAEEAEDDEFFTLAAGDVLDLHPEEIKEVIYQGFEKDLIDPILIDRDYFDELLSEGPEANLSRLQEEIRRHSLESVHEAMAWWAAFDAGPEFTGRVPAVLDKIKQLDQAEKKKKAAKKKKRKIAKASKKKQRR